ncbi:MAG TPA: hypothetical protein PKD61_15595 [Polyangiaceae bacterium]|nr:hypothetical protein [Polyangiaceae bacterium]
MNPEHDDDLRALFDATAEEASGPILTKLQARAREIPTARRPWWSKLALPGFALLAGAAATALLLRAGPQAPLPEPSPVAIAVATPQASAPVAAEEPERDVIATEDEDDELAGLEAVAWGEPDDLWGGVGVEVDAESDELLAALDSWMEEDG